MIVDPIVLSSTYFFRAVYAYSRYRKLPWPSTYHSLPMLTLDVSHRRYEEWKRNGEWLRSAGTRVPQGIFDTHASLEARIVAAGGKTAEAGAPKQPELDAKATTTMRMV